MRRKKIKTLLKNNFIEGRRNREKKRERTEADGKRNLWEEKRPEGVTREKKQREEKK